MRPTLSFAWVPRLAGLAGLGLTLTFGGCQASTSATGGYACAETGECPSGLMCVNDRCVAEPGDVDAPGGRDPDGGGGRDPDGGGGGDPDGGGGGAVDSGGGPPDASLESCYLEERFFDGLDPSIWTLEESGLASADVDRELTLDVSGASGAAAVRLSTDDSTHNYRGQSVFVATPELPSASGRFYFRLRYLQAGEPTRIGFTASGSAIQALGECPGCGAGATTFCEGAIATDDREFEFMRIDVRAAEVELLSSEDGAAWVTRGTCATRISGLTSARLEVGLESTGGSSSATIDDLYVCPTE